MVDSYKGKYVHKVLVNCLVKIAQEKSVVRITDRLELSIAVDWDINLKPSPVVMLQGHIVDIVKAVHKQSGPNFGPIPNAKKYGFFPIQQKKSQFDPPKNVVFFLFGSPSLFHIIQIQNICYIFTISQNNRIQSQMLLSLPFLIVH